MFLFSGADLEALDDDAIGDDSVTDEAQYEEAFAKMKKASGVSDIDEVVRRFETQEETSGHLQELQVWPIFPHRFCLRHENVHFIIISDDTMHLTFNLLPELRKQGNRQE